MSASGKSSNRRYEWGRGYDGGGHGPYASMGASDREQAERRLSAPAPRVRRRIRLRAPR